MHPTLHSHHSIDYIELPVRDLAAAQRFYGAAFGWSFNQYGPDYAGIKRTGGDGEVGGLRKDTEIKERDGGPLVILYSNELETSLAKVESAGGKITAPPFEFPGGRWFHFKDPSGNELGVWSPT